MVVLGKTIGKDSAGWKMWLYSVDRGCAFLDVGLVAGCGRAALARYPLVFVIGFFGWARDGEACLVLGRRTSIAGRC